MEYIEASPNVLKTPSHLRCLLLGASEAGKSTWIGSLIRNKGSMFPEPGYAKFIVCSPNVGASSSPEDQHFQQCLQSGAYPSDIVFLNSIITSDDLMEQTESTQGRILLIIDDFSREIFSESITYDLFTRLSSHKGVDSAVSVHIGTGSKHPGRWYSLIFNNANYFVIFQNIANRASIGMTSKSIFPYGKNFLQRCLNEATNICGVHAYIVVDASLKNPLNNRYGVRTNVFKENNLPTLFFKNPKVYYGMH